MQIKRVEASFPSVEAREIYKIKSEDAGNDTHIFIDDISVKLNSVLTYLTKKDGFIIWRQPLYIKYILKILAFVGVPIAFLR